MKITITFKHNDSANYPVAAITEVNGEKLCALGKTWEEAEAELIAKAKAFIGVLPLPEPKEIEI